MNENSYTKIVKHSGMNQNQQKENSVQNLYVEMLLAEIQLKVEMEKLRKQIDLSLDQHNKDAFLRLSKQYIELNKKIKS